MSGWNPVFKTLTTSSVLMEGPDTVAVWALFLADADQNGVSTLTVPFLAQVLFKGDIKRAQKAMDSLLKPDPHSKNTAYNGRRIIPAEEAGITGAGPWFLTTHEAHRKKMEVRREQDRIRKQRERARKAKKEEPMRKTYSEEDEESLPGEERYDYEGPTPEETAAAFKEPGPIDITSEPTEAMKAKAKADIDALLAKVNEKEEEDLGKFEDADEVEKLFGEE